MRVRTNIHVCITSRLARLENDHKQTLTEYFECVSHRLIHLIHAISSEFETGVFLDLHQIQIPYFRELSLISPILTNNNSLIFCIVTNIRIWHSCLQSLVPGIV